MSVLALRLQKHLEMQDREVAASIGAVATLRQLTDGDGRTVDASTPFDVVIPANHQGKAELVSVAPGRWLIEATLPSGEIITEQVEVADKEIPVTLHAAEHSFREWLGWQHLLGNIEGNDTLRLMQERARQVAEALAREALGKSANPRLIGFITDLAARSVGHLWTSFALPIVQLLRSIIGIQEGSVAALPDKPLLPSTPSAEPATAPTAGLGQSAEPVVQRVALEVLSKPNGDQWTAVLSDAPGGPALAPAKVAPDVATWIYDFDRPIPPPTNPNQSVHLEPREIVSITWRNERFVVMLPLPWPALEDLLPAPAQIMVRRSLLDERAQIGVAVMDETFGSMSGFMIASTLPKAAVVVEKAYELLFGETPNPLAAAAGGYVLVAAGDSEKRDGHPWMESIARLFPGLPDGAVLEGTLLLRSAEDQSAVDRARAAFLRAFDLGIPYFSVGVSWLLEGLTAFSGDPEIDAKLIKVRRIAQRLDLSQAFTVVRLTERTRPTPNLPAIRPPASQDGGSSIMPSSATERKVIGTTFTTIDLKPEATASLDLAEYVNCMVGKLEDLKEERSAYYKHLRESNSAWANESRRVLAVLGSAAFLLTAVAAGLRFAPDGIVGKYDDRIALLAVLAIYAIMGTVAFYEKATDRTASYFRHLSVILAIRDLWTKFQFELLRELTALKNSLDKAAAEPATRERIGALAEAFCTDLNKASAGELTEWRTEFQTSLSDLADAARKGSDDVSKQLQDSVKAAEKAASEAKAAADAAAKALVDAAKPGSFNVAITGDFDDQVIVFVDRVEIARSSGKSVAIQQVAQGMRMFSAQAQKGAKKLEASAMVDVKPGLQELRMTLT